MDPSETFSDIRHLCTKINKGWTLSIQGCYFHFAQAIYRQVGHLGYAMDYRNDAIRSLIALGHVPIHLKHHYYQGFIQAYGADPHISRLCQVYSVFLRDLVRWFVQSSHMDLVQLTNPHQQQC